MPYFRAFVATAFLVSTVRLLAAEESDIRPRVENGRIVTDAYVDETGETFADQRIFSYEFHEDPEDPYFVADPGINAAAGSGLPGGSQLGFNVVNGSLFDWPADLVFWDGNPSVTGTPIALTAPPEGESLSLSLGAASLTLHDTLGGQPGFVIQTVTATGAVHRHLSTNLHAGAMENPAQGLYLLAIELTSDHPAVATSLPLFLVYSNLATEDQLSAFARWIEDQYVSPLPGDANRDGTVDLADFNILKANFNVGTRWSQGNFDGLGTTDLADFNILKANFGASRAAPAPEPCTLSLTLLAAGILLPGLTARKRRRPADAMPSSVSARPPARSC